MSEKELVSIYKSFSSEMKLWNDKFYILMEESAANHREQAVHELIPIFDRYVWEDAKRRDERLVSPSTEDPCDYDPETSTIEKIESSGSDFVIFVQTHSGLENLFRYTFKKRNENWKLSRRDIFLETKKKWMLHHI